MTARIFLVEDDRTLRTTLADALASEGHTVTTAADGDEALSVLRTRAFDLLVLDVMLPGPSGLEILQEEFSFFFAKLTQNFFEFGFRLGRNFAVADRQVW